MSYKVIFLLLSLFLLTFSLVSAANQNNQQVRLFFDSEAEWNQILGLHLDIVWVEADYVEIVTNPDELEELESLGFRTEVVITDISKFFRSRFDATRDMGGYMTLSEINTALDIIIADHPDIVSTKVDIGQTLEGRTMWAVKISDNPNVDEDETEVLFTSAIHAREVITPLVLLNVIDSLTDKYPTDAYIQHLVNNREIWFVLVVNPDGYYYNEQIAPNGGGMWRKNRRYNLDDGSTGVDLNRNFGYYWGYDDVGSSTDGFDETFRGTGPFSEPETQNMRDFSLAHEFKIVVYYHSYSNLILWPWSYNLQTTPDENLFIGLGDSISVFNGYVPNHIQKLYTANGEASDWHYGEQTLKPKSFSFVIEVGDYWDNFWPPTYRIEDLVNENYLSTLFLADASEHIELVLAPNQPELFVEDTVDNAAYQISWFHEDDLNPALRYELVEYVNTTITDPCDTLVNFTVDGFSIVLNVRYHSEFRSLYSGALHNYIGYADTKYPITVGENDVFSFWTYYRIEDGYDYAYVEVSTDNLTWTPIQGNITTNSNPNGLNRGYGITGFSGDWIQGFFDLSAYESQIIFIRLSYYTNETIAESGIFFDDIEMITTFGNKTVLSATIEDNFYLLTDKPNKTDFYYRVRAQDAEGQWGDYSSILKTHTLTPYICGDIDGQTGITILDVVYLINYLYKEGSDPDPLNAAEINGIPPISILDVVYLINYIYKEGPDPNCP